MFNVRADVLAGLTATLALIPDSLAFSFIAGVNPMVGMLLIVTFGNVVALIPMACFNRCDADGLLRNFRLEICRGHA
ncbi:hypothetical protein GCM10008018_38360 [Paenibacillus marchantiophytorum]|uniref:SLC26A/SulP transporter domain-containing protein n=1 Tax=Paenibacillus marchantiophytorum TaxID=1619310 RepID=A0ABQ1EV18_9BACL|nr:SulP family inorganic anion transporter [Paenibacillus marchantiophytorum]GFZ88623.1 hypothetical protein GCM10008018_38360 [Paenibacillus marchantiophytorum]